MANEPEEKKIMEVEMGGYTFLARVTVLPEDDDSGTDTDGGADDTPQGG